MLADEIIAFPQSDAFNEVLPSQRIGYKALAKEVASAERFVLRREAVFLIHTVSDIPASRIIPALQICRMPFPKMWVEFVYKDRSDWHTLNNVHLNMIPDASNPSRLGFLLEQKDDEGRLIEATSVWRHAGEPQAEEVVIGGYSTYINTNENVVVTDGLRELRKQALADPNMLERKFSLVHPSHTPEEEEATLQLEARIELKYCPYSAVFWAFVKEAIPQALDKLHEHALFDALQEWRFILGLLTVLNSRNVISFSEPVTFEKLNKQRLKRGVPPLHDHREIRLSWSRVQRNRLGSQASDLQAHSVRGHWKLRRSGLFWWSHHIRGKGDVQPKPYDVRT